MGGACSFVDEPIALFCSEGTDIGMKINRGDIYIADLRSMGGCEQRGRRPVLVIQNDIGNKYSPVVIIAAITLKRKPKMPTHVELFDEQGVSYNSGLASDL